MKKILGIDLGTTKVAAVITDDNGKLCAVSGAPHCAGTPDAQGKAEQDTGKILACVQQVICDLPAEERKQVSAIGVTGQMHSLLLGNGETVSPLTTWQDQQCSDAFLNRVNRSANITLRNGLGGATLARLAAENALGNWDFCATISDYLTAVLAGNSRIVTDPTHAASWGIFDIAGNKWNEKALEVLNIPVELLPEVQASGTVIGRLSPEYAEKLGLEAGIPIVNAIGDNQASILGTGKNVSEEIYLTLGTGAQLSLVLDKHPGCVAEALEVRPFPGGRFLLVAAPLCGGAAFAWLADMANSFRKALGEEELPRHRLLDKLDALGVAELEKGEPELKVVPQFLGERYLSNASGCISGLTLENCAPGKLAAALALGIIRNLKNGFSAEQLKERSKIIGSGNAVRLIKSIQIAIDREFGLPLELSEGREEAATGAAILCLGSVQNLV